MSEPQAQKPVDRLEDARRAYAAALGDVVSGVRIMRLSLADLVEAERALRLAGGMPSVDASALAQGITAQVKAWERTNAGREVLGLDRLPTHAESVLATAKFDVLSLEERLREAKAVPVTRETVDARRRRIEDLARATIVARRRVAALENESETTLRSWLRRFATEIKNALDAPVIVPAPMLQRLEAEDRERARHADPIGALLADALREAQVG